MRRMSLTVLSYRWANIQFFYEFLIWQVIPGGWGSKAHGQVQAVRPRLIKSVIFHLTFPDRTVSKHYILVFRGEIWSAPFDPSSRTLNCWEVGCLSSPQATEIVNCNPTCSRKPPLSQPLSEKLPFTLNDWLRAFCLTGWLDVKKIWMIAIP